MNLHDPVVVEAEGFAEGVLGDLEPSINVATERGDKMESDGEGQRAGSEAVVQRGFVRGLGQGQEDELGHLGFVVAPHGREDAPAVDRGILVVDARRDGQGDREAGRRNGGLAERLSDMQQDRP